MATPWLNDDYWRLGNIVNNDNPETALLVEAIRNLIDRVDNLERLREQDETGY